MTQKHRFSIALAAAPAFLLLLAAGDTRLSPGLWEVRNTPGVATLDGRPLAELPIGPIKTQTLCLGAAELNDPARFFARDLDPACKVSSSRARGGMVKIGGTCPNQIEGPDANFSLSGRFGRARYEVDFETVAIGNNGRMTFSGKMTGRRVGACPRT